MVNNHIAKSGCTGLVLSGGAARGYVHLGVIKALNEEGIFPDIISGTSAGAIAGALYADGYSPDEILEILGKNSRLDFLALTVPKDGLLKMSGMIQLLKKTLRATTFEELKIPLIITATNLNNARIEYFSSGELLNCIIASASIPVIFKPVVMNNISYVDGGVIDNLPVGPLEKKCSFLIGSYVNSLEERSGFNSLIAIAERAFQLSVTKDLQNKKKKFDIYINPPGLEKYNAFDQSKSHELFDLGYHGCKEKIGEYRKKAAKKHSPKK
jgi:NTE family protein